MGGPLTVSTNLVLRNASISLDLSFGSGDQISVLGSLTLTGTNLLLVNPLTGFGAGTYPIISYGTALIGDVNTNLKLGGAIADSRYTLALDTNTVPYINLAVSGGPAASLTWSGDGTANAWNIKGAANWNGGSGPNSEKFYSLDAVSFDDSGSASPAVNLLGTLLPGSVQVSGTNNYTFAGPGRISGGNGLTMNGSGTLLILTTNDFSEITSINSGTVQLGNGLTADGGLGITPINNYGALIFNAAGNQVILGSPGGSGAVVKRGPGMTQLAGDNWFSYALTNEAGTLLAGSPTAFGDTAYGTTINPGATLDLGGQNIGAEPVTVSDTGVGGAGAVINSGPVAGALQNLTLVGPTTFGGSAGWSVLSQSSSVGLQANTNKITKIGANTIQFGNDDSSYVSDGGLGDLEIQAGKFTFYGYVSLGDPARTITVRTNATLELDNTGDSLTPKAIVLDDGAAVVSTLPNRLRPQYCTVPASFTLGGANTFTVQTADRLVLNGTLAGPGSLIAAGAGAIILGASNTFSGDLNIQAGTVGLTNDASVTRAANILLGGTLDVNGRTDATLTLGSSQVLKGSGAVLGSLSAPAGSTVAPGLSIGAISVSSNATLRGTTAIELSKIGGALSADLLAVGGTLDLGGTLNLTFAGAGLTNGDTFTLFTAGTLANGFATVNLPAVPGVTWTNRTALDGTLRVVSVAPPSQPTIAGAQMVAGGNFQVHFSGTPGYGYSVRAATDVALPATGWTVIGTGTFGSSPVTFTDLNATNFLRRFYLITIP